jgi:toxin YoeB
MVMRYKIIIQPEAAFDLQRLAKSEPKAFAKANRFIQELAEHPKTGLGHPEPLKGKPEGRWSREITKKHRLIYEIHETEVVVIVLTAYGHYGNK